MQNSKILIKWIEKIDFQNFSWKKLISKKVLEMTFLLLVFLLIYIIYGLGKHTYTNVLKPTMVLQNLLVFLLIIKMLW